MGLARGVTSRVSLPHLDRARRAVAPVHPPTGAHTVTGAVRNRYADFLRALAIGLVVLGHWLVTSITYQAGHFQWDDVLGALPWTQWLTLGFQVMPVFFLVGGYANAASWSSHQRRGERWSAWLQHRAARLLVPTAIYVGSALAVVTGCHLAGLNRHDLELAAWAVAIQLWFLPVYLALLSLTPWMHAAHERWGLAVPAVLVVFGSAIDALVLGFGLRLLGWANYLLVWGALHQLGFAWRDQTLTRSRWLPVGLTAGGALALGGLVWLGPYPVSMVGVPGARIDNPSPPSVALLAFALAQTGVVLAAEGRVSRWLERARIWALVSRANGVVMTLYLWHMAPVIVVAVALYPSGLLAQPPLGSAGWWELRVAWVAILAVLVAPMAAVLGRLEQTSRPAGAIAPAGPKAPGLLLAGIALASFALYRFAVGGFYPDMEFPVTAVVAFTAGLLLVLSTRRRPGTSRGAGDAA
jgi:peptidoglycan/LPS O-acetylase OafA/YrhL